MGGTVGAGPDHQCRGHPGAVPGRHQFSGLRALAVLTVRFHIGPSADQTVLSQITGAQVGRGPIYYTVDLATTLILALDANTSFGGVTGTGQPAGRRQSRAPRFRAASRAARFPLRRGGPGGAGGAATGGGVAKYYADLGRELGLGSTPGRPREGKSLVVVAAVAVSG
jgi:hypothetical protein